jgi:hypothetical protein
MSTRMTRSVGWDLRRRRKIVQDLRSNARETDEGLVRDIDKERQAALAVGIPQTGQPRDPG